ncbi:MAG TPA: hypothetical protein VGG74_09120 [Kofleriaceae bacterium]|jgi:hypothetical protein
MRALPILLALSVAGCHHDNGSAAAQASTAEQDALWKLAPAGTKLGIVVSPRGVAMLEHAWADVRAFIAATPELAPMLVKLANVVGTPDLSLASFGLTATKGAALFMLGPDDGVLVVPLADRDAFIAATHATKGDPVDTIDKDMLCTTTHGVYACASATSLFDKLGGGGLDAAAAGTRGDIELVANGLPIFDAPTSFAVVAQLSRGAVTMRGWVAGMPPQVTAALGSASQPRIDDDRTTGFGLAHIHGLIARLADDDNGHLGYGLTGHDVLASIGDPLMFTTRSSSFDIRVPLTNPAPLKTLVIDHCADGPLREAHSELVDGACHFVAPDVPAVALDVWLDGNMLHVGQKSPPAGETIELPPIAKELAEKSWQVALYGRGSSLAASNDMAAYQAKFQELPQVMKLARPLVRVLSFLNEAAIAVRVDGDRLSFVLHVRTAWSNPDDVVAKLLAIDPGAIIAGEGMQLVKPIVDAAPNSPLATDIRAGYRGVLPVPAFVGVMAAVAIPAFIESMNKAKAVDPRAQLTRIGRSLVTAYDEASTFPAGDAALVPAGSCCSQPDHACAVDPAAFASDPIWSKLGFTIGGPTRYQYRYHSDGKTADVEAIGDLDCDGSAATWSLHASGANGPSFDIRPPPPGVE